MRKGLQKKSGKACEGLAECADFASEATWKNDSQMKVSMEGVRFLARLQQDYGIIHCHTKKKLICKVPKKKLPKNKGFQLGSISSGFGMH